MSHGRYGIYWDDMLKMFDHIEPFVPKGGYTDLRDDRDPERLGAELLRRRKFTKRSVATHQIADGLGRCEVCGR